VLRDKLFNLRFRDLLAQFLEGKVHFISSDLIGSFHIKHRENGPESGIIEEGLSVDRCSEELRVVDLAIACVIKFLNEFFNFRLINVDLIILVEELLHFLWGDEAGTIFVHFLELFSQILKFGILRLLHENIHRHLLEIRGGVVGLHLVENVNVEIVLFLGNLCTGAKLGEPSVLEDLRAGKTMFGIEHKHLLD